MKKKTTTKKKENKQIVEIHVYVHTLPNYTTTQPNTVPNFPLNPPIWTC